MEPYAFEPRLSRAATLPSSWYQNPAVLAKEQRTVFGRSWQWVGHLSQLAKAGDYLTCVVGEEPVLVTRTEGGELRAFSNVCRHRAGAVALGCGNRKKLQCQYHGWIYDLEGRLLKTPEFEGVENFDAAEVRLPAFRVECWGPMVFVNTSAEGPDLAQWLGRIPAETAHLPLDRMRHYRSLDYHLACNWKVYVDNYLEGYHIPVAHPELFRQLDYVAYRVELFRHYSKQHSPVKATDTVFHRGLGEGEAPEALYYWIFPNLMLNLYPDHLQVNHILPLGPERTLTRFEWFVPDPLPPDWSEKYAENLAFSEAVQQEDIFLCESVQRGLRSLTYERGRYSVARENGVHHFHGLWCEAMGG